MNEQEEKVLAAFDWMGRTIRSFSRGSEFEGSQSEPIEVDGKPAVLVTLPDNTQFTVVLEGWPNLQRGEQP